MLRKMTTEIDEGPDGYAKIETARLDSGDYKTSCIDRTGFAWDVKLCNHEGIATDNHHRAVDAVFETLNDGGLR